MIKLAIALLMVFVNFIMFFLYGSLITGRFKKTGFSATISIITGFFVLLIVFDLCCFPVMLKWRPLSLLSGIWLAVTLGLCAVSVLINRRLFAECFKRIGRFIAGHPYFTAAAVLLVLAQLVIIGLSYDFTLDASYYVARVTTDVTTNTINIYDPYTGEWTDHFEFRYFFSTYPTLCAVIAYLTGIHPLTFMKVVMSLTSVILFNLLMFMIGRELFEGAVQKQLAFMFFVGLMLFFFSSIYTPAQFLVTRSYEGKAILGNVVLPFILYLTLLIYKDVRRTDSYVYLFITCLGATALSNSANMLLPAMLFCTLLPAFIKFRARRILVSACLSAAPCIILLLLYVAYVKGMFVFYTYPR